MKNEDADISLDGLVKFLKRKKMEGNELKDDDDKETTNQQSNKKGRNLRQKKKQDLEEPIWEGEW
ncbi:hypothetical protein BVC80_1831g337 [Macleaya cordata]|uniref:Uncharacterized protein n=1 Tax=Macleaya cordata TaxID=56857 RepID=A0A200R7S3_MACCD|nr:hypothetical protein BVC80_1831g337 [Macleaya cordata]